MGSGVAVEDSLQFLQVATEVVDLRDEGFCAVGCAPESLDHMIQFEREVNGLRDIPAREDHSGRWTSEDKGGQG